MGFKLLLLNPFDQEGMEYVDAWPDKLRETIPDMEISLARSVGEAMEVIGEVDAAFGNIAPNFLQEQTTSNGLSALELSLGLAITISL